MPERVALLIAIVGCAALLGGLAKLALNRRRQIEAIDPSDLEPGSRVVLFSSPYCHGCTQWLAALEGDAIKTTKIDLAERPDAAARYRVSSTPRVVVVEPGGSVAKEFHHYEPRRSDLDQIIRLTRP